jgi:hypothetical protein
MFLDGMGDQLSGLERDEAGGDDHAEGDPLDGIEQVAQWNGVGVGLAKKSQEKLGYTGGGEGGGCGFTCAATGGEVAEKADRDEDSGYRCIERDRMQAGGRVRGDGKAPG